MIPVYNLPQGPTELAASAGFRLFSHHSLLPDLPPVRIMQYACGLTLSGTARETIGLQSYELQPHTVVCTFPGQIISYTDPSPDLGFVYCVFDDDFLNSPHLNRSLLDGFGFFQAAGCPVVNLSPATGQRAQELFANLQAECTAQRPDHALLLRLYLLELFVLVNREYAPVGTPAAGVPTRGEQISRQFKELVSQHFRRLKQVRDYADLLCITPRHLSQMVTTNTGRAPSQWIRAMEVLEAKYLLRYATTPVAAIAHELGYEDPAYFSKVFRQAAGCSPQQYRQG
ncbi:helix-turn-helix transcriptional regulator [Hymenobacter sp. BT664]|uniref:Helix-turn-helix transcriptional regulator n=1 Tax=Hymenobacter montanus TaxID=2771359 RepID=A0A927BGK4_9BACT|nr:AraC family transcriptional regulator [Hymenobacter montanus]MBD2769513.1 helix-turn-helix transcriptional regulator [Hymenobacter montanus]